MNVRWRTKNGALDRSLQDLHGNIRPLGNALIVLAEDFRRTLSVIPRSSPADEINDCLKCSALATLNYKSDEAVMNPKEFLNSLDLLGMPPHVLQLKIGVPLLRCEISTNQNFATARGLQ
ncbi:unnamed protein product [Onchocerca ochengi]|uniref:ATP-dependent DNA helicase n=1 Tax=Onchocerca ochengi TaxID=42157 RepID=A0A182ENR5_ONCOC|nr:unnamed protein product [Onchocerca ochengi]